MPRPARIWSILKWTEAVFTIEFANKLAKYLVWRKKLLHLIIFLTKIQQDRKNSAKFEIVLTVKMLNL